MTERLWVIWSEEHGAWWGPGEMGYVRSLARAGCYTEADARRIVARANRCLDPPHFNEIAMPDPIPGT